MTLLDRIRAEIENVGPIPFSRYMELALYDPEAGFYATAGAGRRHDFITSPEVGPLFGRLVAAALDRWWIEMNRPAPFHFVEVGAGPGTLARSILVAEPECAPVLEYTAVEVSPGQRELHPEGIRSQDSLPDRVECGVVFANELLDNLPFDIAAFDPSSGWSDLLVGSEGERLIEVLRPGESPSWIDVAPAAPVRVPVQHRARQFLRNALASVSLGKVVVIDYAVAGYPTDDQRRWLRTYREHGSGEEPLDDPGGQDITADVDLSALNEVREPSRLVTQSEWLDELGIEALVAEGREYWQSHAARPDLRAIEMRSRANEAAALKEPDGLGGFTVVEWDLPPVPDARNR